MSAPLDLASLDNSWSVFLDRDGVINVENPGHYIHHRGEFEFTAGALDALQKIRRVFGRMLVVTNQRGVGKGLMKLDDLLDIHAYMDDALRQVGVSFDKVYVCTEVDDSCVNRKPNPGMAMKAFRDFPDIDPSKSIMVGNKMSDMKFGRAAGMHTIFIASTNPEIPFPHPDIDLRFDSLAHFAKALQ